MSQLHSPIPHLSSPTDNRTVGLLAKIKKNKQIFERLMVKEMLYWSKL